MTLPLKAAFETFSASEYNDLVSAVGASISVQKPVDTSLGTITLTADPHLFIDVAANAIYSVDAWLICNASTTGKLLLAATGPTGSVFQHWLLGLASGASGATGAVDHFAFTTFGSWARGGTGAEEGLIMNGTLYTGGTAGTFRITWAQVVASGATIMKQGSRMTLRKIG